jgi:hypothetical protein
MAELLAVHSEGHVAAVEALSSTRDRPLLAQAQKFLAPDTLGNKHTALAARVAAGTAAELATQVVSGQADGAFGVIRPLGGCLLLAWAWGRAAAELACLPDAQRSELATASSDISLLRSKQHRERKKNVTDALLRALGHTRQIISPTGISQSAV